MIPRRLPLLDEQAQRLLASEHANMLACVRCGQCLTSCPTYILSGLEAESPRGRIAMARAVLEGRVELTPDLLVHERNCLVCDACTAVCPAGVHMDPIQVALRTATRTKMPRSPISRIVQWLAFRVIFARMWAFRLVVTCLWLYQRSGLQWLLRASRVLRLLGLEAPEALLPPIANVYLVPKGEEYSAQGASDAPTRVSFFAGCVMSTALAEIDRATIRVLTRAGLTVTNTARQGCCGALHAHGGDLEGAKLLAVRNIEAFAADADSLIVNNSAGCGAMLKDYAHHFRDDPGWADRAKAFSGRVRDATEVLATRELPMRRPSAAAVTYQEPCHLVHAQRVSQQPRSLLKSIPGLELREMADSSLCCGSAGVYNLTNPAESRQLLARKLDNALATGAQTIVTANPGCLLQLRGGLAARGVTARVKHIMELLDEATR